MKAFEQEDGTVSREHHYVLFRHPQTGEQIHCAIPKVVRMIDAITALKALLPEPWFYEDLSDPYYGRDEPEELIAKWSREFTTDLAISAARRER